LNFNIFTEIQLAFYKAMDVQFVIPEDEDAGSFSVAVHLDYSVIKYGDTTSEIVPRDAGTIENFV
jgi:hypothetical protein